MFIDLFILIHYCVLIYVNQFLKMAMRNNLDNNLKASNYKQVKRPNGKYGHISLQNGISKCDICGKNVQIMKLFDHIKESHRQYFCIVCRARFKIHKDLISHIQDIHKLVASDNLNKAQDAFSDNVNKRYFAQPLPVSRLPIPPTTIPQFSNSSSDDDELNLDNLDVLDVVLGTKSFQQRKEEMEVFDIINNIIKDVINDVKAEELFESTLQDLSCSDISLTDESDYKTLKKLDILDDGIYYSQYPKYQKKDENILSNTIDISENKELPCKKVNTLRKISYTEHPKSLQTLNNDEEEFKLGIKNMSTVLSEKSPWVNGSDTLQNIDNSTTNDNDLPVMALTLDHKLTDMNLNAILKECIRTSCLTCIYCHNCTCIAVNGKQLALHLIEEHRFMTVKNESSEDFVNVLKSNLNALENIYLNSENFDSTDDQSHTPFNNTFYCFNCQFTSKQMKEVNSHKRSVHSRKTYDCIMCKITFSNYGELHCHMCPGADLGVWQNLSFRCLFCGQGQIPSAFRCMVHLRKSHNACDYCLETFPNQQSLALHVNKHKMRHMCLKCNITYLSKKDIFEHMFWKHNRDSKECKLCLTKKWPYTYHFCVPPAIFTCDECKRTFSNALLLRVHERWHSDNIPYECKTCHNKFISKKLLVKHEIIHKEVISPIKKKKKKKKKKGDDYNLPPLNLSSDSDTEKTPRHKPEKYLKSPSPSGNNYWDYVSKQKKELVHIALLDHDYTLLSTSQSEIVKSPQCSDELIVNGSENILNNSLCQRSSCSSHCNSSSSSSSSCGTNCSCSSSCSSSCNSDAEEKIKPVVESPKKHKKKKKVKKIKVLSAKKIANFNLCALETDLESEFSNTDNEEYYDINPIPLHPEVNSVPIDISQLKEENHIENSLISSTINNSLSISQISITNNHNLNMSPTPLNTFPYQSSNFDIESQILEKSHDVDLPDQDYKITDESEILKINYASSINHLSSPFDNLLSIDNYASTENNLDTNLVEICNGNNNLQKKQNELNLNVHHNQEVNSSYHIKPNKKKRFVSPALNKRKTKQKTTIKISKNLSQLTKEVVCTTPISINPYSTNLSKDSITPNDTRQSKRQLKKRKFFGYDSSDEDQIPNGGDSISIPNITPNITTPNIQSLTKKRQKKSKPKSELPLRLFHTSKLIQSQQTRPIVDVRISKSVLPPVTNNSDSDSGNLVIELPKIVEQKAVQSTERLYCHCRCPYDEVSEMIACDNPNCRVEWFHFDCVGITVAPKGNWYCPDCR